MRLFNGIGGKTMTHPTVQSGRPAAQAMVLEGEAERAGELRPAIAEMLDGLALASGAARLEDGLVLEKPLGPTRLRVCPVEFTADDGERATETITITTELPAAEGLTERAISRFNRFAALSAIVPDGESGTPILVSRLSTYEGWDESLEFYGTLLLFALMLHDEGFLAAGIALRTAFGALASEPTNLGSNGEHATWGREEFEALAAAFERSDILAFAGEHGLKAEIPWAPGALSAAFGDSTSLLTLDTRVSHPRLGDGLFFHLELPREFSEEELPVIANWLNRIEADAVDAPPFFGAWCTGLSETRLVFVGFWPTLLYRDKSLQTLAAWLKVRSDLAHGYLEALLEGGRRH